MRPRERTSTVGRSANGDTSCQFETVIKARIPQLKFSDGTVEELTVPWAERYSRVTTMMASFVIKLLEACPTTQAVCTLTRLSWSTVTPSWSAP